MHTVWASWSEELGAPARGQEVYGTMQAVRTNNELQKCTCDISANALLVDCKRFHGELHPIKAR
jgi:hypothetical protein